LKVDKYLIDIDATVSSFNPIVQLWLNNGLSNYTYRLAAYVIHKMIQDGDLNTDLTIELKTFNRQHYKADLANISYQSNKAIEELKYLISNNERLDIHFEVINSAYRSKQLHITNCSKELHNYADTLTKRILKSIIGLRTIYAIRLYLLTDHAIEACDTNKESSFYAVHCNELIAYLLQEKASQYENKLTSFCRRVVEPSIDHINKYTNIRISQDEFHGNLHRDKSGKIGFFAFRI